LVRTRHEREPDTEGLRREARVAGLRDFTTPSLEAVERKRMQLWALMTIALIGVAASVLLSSGLAAEAPSMLSAPMLRLSVVVLAGAFCVYMIEKELHHGRITHMLTDERVLTAALTNRLHEVTLLLEAGKAMNAELELPAVIETILRSATDLLDANGGSVMLREDDDLVAVAVRGRDEARDTRLRIGDGIAGYVALRREPLLIQGHADPREFPGLADREPYVESAMSVPLVHHDEVLGVLNVNAARGSAFTQYDLRALAVFAEQAASAIMNARLFEAERAHVAELLDLRAGREAS
jgi:putative methionine-R-sulfoxide reductase with GAF domain